MVCGAASLKMSIHLDMVRKGKESYLNTHAVVFVLSWSQLLLA